MNALTPDITAAEVVHHGVLQLTFADGLSGEVDVLDRMLGPVFEETRTSEGFSKVHVDSETGTVVWPGGADLAPDTLYERALGCLARVPLSGLGRKPYKRRGRDSNPRASCDANAKGRLAEPAL